MSYKFLHLTYQRLNTLTILPVILINMSFANLVNAQGPDDSVPAVESLPTPSDVVEPAAAPSEESVATEPPPIPEDVTNSPPQPPLPEESAGASPPPAMPTLPGSLAAPDPTSAFAGPSVQQEIDSLMEPFIYEAEGRRDPFSPFSAAKQMQSGPSMGPRLPLQRFDLKDVRLIGIIWGVRNPKAMFLDPNNQVHVLGKDDRIGRNNGYVAVIREGEVVVVEAVEIRGELAYTTQVLKMER